MSIVGFYYIHGITAGDEALVSLEHRNQGLEFAVPAHNIYEMSSAHISHEKLQANSQSCSNCLNEMIVLEAPFA